MTSNINYTSINENFPVAGQDNDTQVFRDNFDTIKTSLRSASTEITDLQDNVVRKDTDNDLNLNIVTKAVFQNTREQKFDGSNVTATTTIDYENGPYQIFRVGANINMQFLNLPGDPNIVPVETTPIGFGKIRLELYSDGSSRNVTFITSGGTVIKKDSSFPGVLTLTSADNPVFIDVWRHSSDVIFMQYLGTFA